MKQHCCDGLYRLSVAVVSLAVLPLHVGAEAPTPTLAGLDDYVVQAMGAWEVPGMAVAVVKDDAVVLAKGYGIREIGKPGPVDADTLFAIGSNTKAFTVTALGMLVSEDKLGWDDPVITHMPTLQLYDPYATREITVRDLLCHRAGYGTWSGDFVAWGSTYDREELIRRLRFLKPECSFRSRFGYSNAMFLVAGQLIPRVAGTSWDDFLNQRIFEPLGMSRTNTSVRDLDGVPNVAAPHTRVEGEVVAIPYANIDNDAPAGSINSSALDMARWIRMQLGNGTFEGMEIVSADALREARTPHTVVGRPSRRAGSRSKFFAHYGLGWVLADYAGRQLVTHDGGVDGMLSQVALIPEDKLGVVVLTNFDDQRLFAALCLRVLDAMLGLEPRDLSGEYLERFKKGRAAEEEAKKEAQAARAKDTEPSHELAAYCGRYTNELYGEAAVAEEGGRLVLHPSAHPSAHCVMEHWHYDTFLCRWNNPTFGESMIPFGLDAEGNVETFRLRVRPEFIDPLEYEFTRVE